MAYTSTKALVLRRVDWRDNDRILTLLTASRGRVDAVARGCRKPNSPLMPASELFTLGDYVLYKGKGHELITSCQVEDSYYPLRNDYEKLSYAAIMLRCAELSIQPEEPQEHLLILLTRSLFRLAYTGLDERAVTAAYLLHFAALNGYKPRLEHCAVCGQRIEAGQAAWLSPAAGGLVCRTCHTPDSTAQRLEPDAVFWLKSVLKAGIEKTEPGISPVPLAALKRYVEQALDQRLPALPEYVVKI